MFQLFLYYYVVYLFYSFITLLGSFFNISYILLEQLFCISRRNYDLVSYFSTVSQYTGTNNADSYILKTAKDISDAERLLWALSRWLIYYALKFTRWLAKVLWDLLFGEDDDSNDHKPGGGGAANAIAPNTQMPPSSTNVFTGDQKVNHLDTIPASEIEQKVPEPVLDQVEFSLQFSAEELISKVQEILTKYVGTNKYTWISISEFLDNFNEPFRPFTYKLFSYFKEYACSSSLKTKVALLDNGEGLLALLDESVVSSSNLNILTFQDTSLVLPRRAIYFVVKLAVTVYTANPAAFI